MEHSGTPISTASKTIHVRAVRGTRIGKATRGRPAKRPRLLESPNSLANPTVNDKSIDKLIERLLPKLTPIITAIISSTIEPLIKTLKDNLQPALNINPTTTSPNDPEERDRPRSIVISGLSESMGKPSEKREHDLKAVTSLIDDLGTEATPVAIFRMGATQSLPQTTISARPRPPRLLKIIFATSSQQRSILRDSRILRDSTTFRGVFVRPSLTKQQRDEEFNLRQELRKLRDNGERVMLVGQPGTSSRQIRKLFNVNNGGASHGSNQVPLSQNRQFGQGNL